MRWEGMRTSTWKHVVHCRTTRPQGRAPIPGVFPLECRVRVIRLARACVGWWHVQVSSQEARLQLLEAEHKRNQDRKVAGDGVVSHSQMEQALGAESDKIQAHMHQTTRRLDGELHELSVPGDAVPRRSLNLVICFSGLSIAVSWPGGLLLETGGPPQRRTTVEAWAFSLLGCLDLINIRSVNHLSARRLLTVMFGKGGAVASLGFPRYECRVSKKLRTGCEGLFESLETFHGDWQFTNGYSGEDATAWIARPVSRPLHTPRSTDVAFVVQTLPLLYACITVFQTFNGRDATALKSLHRMGCRPITWVTGLGCKPTRHWMVERYDMMNETLVLLWTTCIEGE